jgi:hypothetical protein
MSVGGEKMIVTRVLTTTAERFVVLRKGKAVWEASMASTWNSTRLQDIIPAERCINRKVLKEIPRISARNPRCGPRKRGIMLISERFPARTPAFAMSETRKPTQKELQAMYTS